ncbi:MAG: NADP-dependent oxidoreductase [Alphaproteobacteria bacterium]|nr:NADP-dependent oxidoreductase [Alphaproteobacteria bacterium]
MTETPANDTGALSAKAVSYTEAGTIEIADRAVRAPQATEIRIRVKAAAVSPVDVALRGMRRPLTPGMDAAGIVESVGSGVTRLRPGQEVMAAVGPIRPEGGAQASYIVIPAASAVPIPAGASLAEASTLPMNGLTALLALELAGLKPGQVLAVTGGAGWLAHCAIVLAKHQGLKVVADAKAPEIALVRGYGADIVVERSDDFAGAVRRAVPDGADALLDTALLAEQCWPALKDGGVYLPVRGWGEKPAERGIQIKPVWVNQALERTEWLELLREQAASGAIRLRVAGTFPLEQVEQAQAALKAGGLRGRPVILL